MDNDTHGSTVRRARVMATREMGTEDLFGLALAQLATLKAQMKGRSNRDAASRVMTNLYVSVEMLARRLGDVEFSARTPSMEEEDELPERAEETTLADLFAEPEPEVMGNIDYLQSKLCRHCKPAVEEVMCEGCRETLALLTGELEKLRAHDFTVAMKLFCEGAKNIPEMAKRIVTTMQSTMPGLLEGYFGISLTSIGGRMGEGRQTTQARKKRLVETTLKSAGMKGFKGLGGARSDQHRERCKQAQQGNQSRAKGELRKRSS